MNTIWLRDTAERVVATFLQAFLAALLAGPLDLVSVGTLRAAALGGIAAALSVIKAALATRLPGTISPASVAPS